MVRDGLARAFGHFCPIVPSALVSARPAPGGTGFGKWSRGTRACSRRRDTVSSAIRKAAPATSPTPLTSQPSSVTCGCWQEDTSLVVAPTPRPGYPHLGRDRPTAAMARDLPLAVDAAQPRPLASGADRSARNDSSEMSLSLSQGERYARALASGWSNPSARQRHSSECSYGACRRHAPSHATTPPPSIGPDISLLPREIVSTAFLRS